MVEGSKRTHFEQIYREYLKEYCGQIPYFGDDERLNPLSLESIYTPLKICKGALVENSRVENSSEEQIDIDTLLERLDRQIDEILAGVTPGEQVEGKNDLDLSGSDQASGRITTIYAHPGGGKTTWSKRVCIACLSNDEKFLSEQPPLRSWTMDAGLLPLLLCCRNMPEVNSSGENGFFPLAYEITSLSFGKNFCHYYSEQDFQELISEKAKNGHAFLIVDGWDELANEEVEKNFENALKCFLKDYPKVKCVITTRGQQKLSELISNGDAYTIEALKAEDVRQFCKRWHEEIFRGDPQRIENYKKVIHQLESPFFSRISYMTKTPYLLSNLLRCSQYYGRLPSNIVELYDRITDVMIEWFTKLDTGLEKHDVMIQLSYIACAMTKNRKLTISKDELCKLLGQCFYDLDGLFRRPLQGISVEQYLTQFLSRNCVLEATYGEMLHFPHREMQDYFSAIAVVNGYLESEDNSRDPMDILKSHYTANDQSERELWEMVVAFSVLISGPRFARLIVGDIIALTENEDNEFDYRDLLFSLVLNNADLLKSDRLHIYETCFARQISTVQINGICQLAEVNEIEYEELTGFIKSGFKDSVDKGDLLYCFAWATICARQMVYRGTNPLYVAEEYLKESDSFIFATGLAILDVFSWCKYENISGNEFSVYYREKRFQISTEGYEALKSALMKNVSSSQNSFVADIARTIYSCVLSEYLVTSSVKEIAPENLLLALLNREDTSTDAQKALDYLLAIYPVPAMEEIPTSSQFGSEAARAFYAHRFENDWKSMHRDSLAFSFNRCLVMGVWKTEDEVKEQLAKFKGIWLDTPNRLRFSQIKRMLAFFSIRFCRDETSVYEIYVQREQVSDGNDQYIDHLSTIDVVPDEICVAIQNNIAYLVRRGELRCVRVDSCRRHSVKAEELLERGTHEKEGFSLINFALAISGFSKNHTGSYEDGLKYLKGCFSPPPDTVRDIMFWWWQLAKESDELEGAVVLLWLFELGCISLVCEVTEERDFSYDDMEFLVTRFRERIEQLDAHCRKTLQVLEEYSNKKKDRL